MSNLRGITNAGEFLRAATQKYGSRPSGITITYECRECEHRWTRTIAPLRDGRVLDFSRAISVPAGAGCLRCELAHPETCIIGLDGKCERHTDCATTVEDPIQLILGWHRRGKISLNRVRGCWGS